MITKLSAWCKECESDIVIQFNDELYLETNFTYVRQL